MRNAGSVSLSKGIVSSTFFVLLQKYLLEFRNTWLNEYIVKLRLLEKRLPNFSPETGCLWSALVFLGEGVRNTNFDLCC